MVNELRYFVIFINHSLNGINYIFEMCWLSWLSRFEIGNFVNIVQSKSRLKKRVSVDKVSMEDLDTNFYLKWN